MHKRNITGGAILGAALLGSLFAMGQDSMPRPRPVVPPPAAENEPAPAVKTPTVTPPALTEKPLETPAPIALPSLPLEPEVITPPIPKEQIQPIQHIEKKAEKPPLPAPPMLIDLPEPTKMTPPGPLPPTAPTSDPLPPPVLPVPDVAPVAPPVLAPDPPPTVVPKEEPKKAAGPASAAPTPWTPTDTPAAKDIKTPELSAPPKVTPVAPPLNDPPPPAPFPSTPVSNPTSPPTSRFVVSPRSTQPTPPVPQDPPPQVETPSAAAPQENRGHGIPYFQMVRRQPVVSNTNKAPAPLPRIQDIARPSDVPVAPAIDPQLGALTPQLTVEKRGPLFHKVGGPLKYQIVLRNVGGIAAQHVRVEDEVPGAQLISATPAATQQTADRISWILPSLRPGEERTFLEEFQPMRPGDVVSTTSVQVYASTSFRTKLEGDPSPLVLPPGPAISQPGPNPTPFPPILEPAPLNKNAIAPPPNPNPPVANPLNLNPPNVTGTPTVNGPSLNFPPNAPRTMPMTVEVKALPNIAVGKKMIFEVVIKNIGTTPLTGLALYGRIPAGFSHPEGDNIGADLPSIAPGDLKVFKMPMTAIAPGKHLVEIRVTAAPDFELVARPVITVEGPAGPALQQQSSASNTIESNSTLQVQLIHRDAGPLDLGKETIYAVRVTNTGGSLATNVQPVVSLSDGLDFGAGVQAKTIFRISGKDMVFGPLPRLAPGATEMFHLSIRGSVSGDQRVRVQVVSDQVRAPVAREERLQVR